MESISRGVDQDDLGLPLLRVTSNGSANYISWFKHQSPPSSTNLLAGLPLSLLYTILRLLDAKDILSVSTCSRYCRQRGLEVLVEELELHAGALRLLDLNEELKAFVRYVLIELL